MTIVACWLDTRFGIKSLTALADARASAKVDTTWFTHSDNTIKLFAINVRCFKPDALEPGLGVYIDPYFETTIGLGFAGDCFEALTIVAHIQRAMGSLLSLGYQNAIPESEGLVNLVAVIATRYLCDHTYGSKRSLEMLLFGWDGPDQPWIWKCVWNKKKRVVDTTKEQPELSNIVTVGDGRTVSGTFGVATRIYRKVVHRIRKVRSENLSGTGDLSEAILAINASQCIEKALADLIQSQFVYSVGGVRQKLQIVWHKDRAHAIFTTDEKPQISDGLPSVTRGALLAPIPVNEKMK